MAEPFAYLNGQLLPFSQATLPLHDAGFVLGATVTDMARTYCQKLYRWPDHLARFRHSLELARFDAAIDDAQLTAWAEDLVRRNAVEGEVCLVVFATPGPIGYYRGETADERPTLGLHTFPLPVARYAGLIERGANLVVPSIRASSIDPHIKQRSRLHWWLAGKAANDLEAGAQALLLDVDGYLTETAAANIVLVQGDRLFTPKQAKVLDGISLRVLTELCTANGMRIEERDLTLDDLAECTEALLTSTPYGVAGVRRLHGRELTFPGPMFVRLRDAWSAALGVDIHADIRM